MTCRGSTSSSCRTAMATTWAACPICLGQSEGDDLRAQGSLRRLWRRPAERLLSQGAGAAARAALLRRHAARGDALRQRLAGRNIRLIDKTTEIAPGLHLIALVSDKPGTLELRELSLAIDTPDGMVIVVGCAHPGIDNIVRAAAAINPRIHLIAGGLHLVVARDADIEAIDCDACATPSGWPGSRPGTAPGSRPSPPCSARTASTIFTPVSAPASRWAPGRARSALRARRRRAPSTRATGGATARCSRAATTPRIPLLRSANAEARERRAGGPGQSGSVLRAPRSERCEAELQPDERTRVGVPAPGDPERVAGKEQPEADIAPRFMRRGDEPGGEHGDDHGRPLKQVEQCVHRRPLASAAPALVPILTKVTFPRTNVRIAHL